ncbi:MAG TPA: queuosine precursor transporter [Verrucomicrobiae bacterium]|nr:queuosine precursor transporter [Verrucomicrobiae bacterium]
MKRFRYYDLILAAFAALLLISNIGAVKLIDIAGIITDGGAILFPLTYLLGDVLTEVYGYKYARRAIWTGFGISVLLSATLFLVQIAPPAAAWPNQAAFETVLGFVPRIVLASLCGYLIGQFFNAFVLAKLKQRTKGKKLWARLIGSTIVGEFFDTLVFCTIAFAGILSGQEFITYVAFGLLYKTAVEIILLPVTYRVISFLKKREQQDSLDDQTNFTPFKVSTD